LAGHKWAWWAEPTATAATAASLRDERRRGENFRNFAALRLKRRHAAVVKEVAAVARGVGEGVVSLVQGETKEEGERAAISGHYRLRPREKGIQDLCTRSSPDE